jgi:hypothetical protein
MIYASSITTDAGTAEGAREDVILGVISGLIWLFEVDFPPGCCGLLHVQVFDGLYQVLPASVGESLHGDAVTMRFDDLYFKESAPFELKIRSWNEDDTWPHTVQVRVGLAATRAEMSRYMPALSFEDFEKMLAESIAQQEVIKQMQLETALKQMTGG